MVGWHHRFNGHEFEQALGVGDGQGSLACCSPRGRKEADITEQLNWTDINSGGHRTCRILFPNQGLNLYPLQWKCRSMETWSLYPWTVKKVPMMLIYSLVTWARNICFSTQLLSNTGLATFPNPHDFSKQFAGKQQQEGFLSFTYPVLVTNNIEALISLAHSHLSLQRRSSIQLHSSQKPLEKLLFAWSE